MSNAIFICGFSSGLDDMPRKDQRDIAKVLQVLERCGCRQEKTRRSGFSPRPMRISRIVLLAARVQCYSRRFRLLEAGPRTVPALACAKSDG